MDVTMTQQQYEQVLASKEFADKFNELTKGWKPENKLPDFARVTIDGILSNCSFASMNMDIDTYRELISCEPNSMEWGLQQKVCAMVLNSVPDRGISGYLERIKPFYTTVKEIETHVGAQHKAAVQSTFLQLKARRELLK